MTSGLLSWNLASLKDLPKRLFSERRDKEADEYRRLARENPGDMRIRRKLADRLYRGGKGDETVAVLLEIAEHFEKSDFVLKAIEAYKNILKIRPDLTAINLNLAGLYLKVNMRTEAGNQLRIAIAHFAKAGDAEKSLAVARQLVQSDPSPENRAKLAEIYQSSGMTEEAVKLYEVLAREARTRKDFDRLLHYYELILPHRPEGKGILRDVCILYLRRKQPDRALNLMERYKVAADPDFAELNQKAKLMQDALKHRKK